MDREERHFRRRDLHERALRLAAEDELANAHAANVLQERDQLDAALRDGLVDAALEHAEKTLVILMACACDVAQLADEAADHVEPDDQADVVAAVSLAETVTEICKHLIEETFPQAPSDRHVAEVKRLLQIAVAARQRTTTAAIQAPKERA